VKRITAVEPPRLMQFEVVEQCLGIEGCVIALGGSYQIHPNGYGSDIMLTTKYRAFLHPRRLWRPLEKLVTTQLHKHVLNGMRGSSSANSREVPMPAKCLASQCSLKEESHAHHCNHVPAISDRPGQWSHPCGSTR